MHSTDIGVAQMVAFMQKARVSHSGREGMQAGGLPRLSDTGEVD